MQQETKEVSYSQRTEQRIESIVTRISRKGEKKMDKLRLTDEEFKSLAATKSETEWNTQCSNIKRSRGGAYPSDWYHKVVLSGLMAKTIKNWK